MRIHSVIERSRVNGPGIRYTIWFQGCSIHCKGCANKELWEFKQGEVYTPEELFARVWKQKGIDGISITGGEPLDQYDDLIEFLELCHPYIEVFLTSGYTLEQIKERYPEVLELVDILISGPYIEEQIDKSTAWRGSTNQVINLLSDRAQKYKDYKPKYATELIFGTDGNMIATGFTMPDFIEEEKKNMADKKTYSNYTTCDKCNTRILKGDVRPMKNGDEVCEYCSDSYEADEKDY